MATIKTITTPDGVTHNIGGSGGGGVTDVKVNGSSVVSGGVASVTVPTKTSDISNDSGYITSSSLATVATTGAYSDLTGRPTIPTKTSDLTNDSGFITSSGLATVATTGNYNDLTNKPTIPTSTSELTNDSGFVSSSSLATVATTGSYNDLTNKPTIPTVSVTQKETTGTNIADITVNGVTTELYAPATGLFIASYGNSTYAQVLDAYQSNMIVYCRASTNSNPGSGSQNRMAFLAYVNNVTTPTEFEFQYYRSVATHTATQQGDQVYVYKLNSSGTWSVTVREAYTTIVAGTGMSSSYSSGTLTLNSSGTSYTFSGAGTSTDYTITATPSSGTAQTVTIPEVTTTDAGLLSSSDKTKLNSIASGAEVNVQSDWNQSDSTADDYIKNKPSVPSASDINNWNSKTTVQIVRW